MGGGGICRSRDCRSRSSRRRTARAVRDVLRLVQTCEEEGVRYGYSWLMI